MGRNGKSAEHIGRIGGSDGPTSVFIVGGGKPNLRKRLQKWYYTCKKSRAAKRIVPGTHTMEEVVTLLKSEYGFADIPGSDESYIREYEAIRSSFLMQYRPELLGELSERPELLSRDAEGIKAWQEQYKLREQRAREIPKEMFDIELYILEKKTDDATMRFILEAKYAYIGGSMSGSSSGRGGKRVGRQVIIRGKKRDSNERNYHEIFKKVHMYYGVTEQDIRENTRRYKDLLTAMVH